jgi:hypothetical protein
MPQAALYPNRPQLHLPLSRVGLGYSSRCHSVAGLRLRAAVAAKPPPCDLVHVARGPQAVAGHVAGVRSCASPSHSSRTTPPPPLSPELTRHRPPLSQAAGACGRATEGHLGLSQLFPWMRVDPPVLALPFFLSPPPTHVARRPRATSAHAASMCRRTSQPQSRSAPPTAIVRRC